MRVYLARHGIALNLGEKGVATDAERPLSAEGRQKTAEVGRGLAQLECRPNRVVTSPLTRAAQTAAILSQELGLTTAAETCDLLIPGKFPEDTIHWLAAQTSTDIMLVGHLPDMPRLASLLVAGHTRAAIEFKKAAVCCLSWDGPPRSGAAQLEWLLQPAQLRALAAAK